MLGQRLLVDRQQGNLEDQYKPAATITSYNRSLDSGKSQKTAIGNVTGNVIRN